MHALRASAYLKIIHTYALPPNQNCIMYNNNDANVRWQQCGPLFMCQSCCFNIHSKLGYYHFAELWQICIIQLMLNN